MHIDDQEQIFNNDTLIGKLKGFIFQPSETYQPSDEPNDEAENFILDTLIKKIDRLINEGDAALRLNTEFNVTFNEATVAKLLPTEEILKPDFNPVLDDRIQGIPLARLALNLESWLKRQINAIADPLDILNKTEDLSPEGQEFVKLLSQYLGYAPRHKINTLVKKISADDRVKLRKSGVRFAQYGVFIRDLLKPGAQKIKLILWALKNHIPLPEMPPSGVVSIPYHPEYPEGYYDVAGYKICGDYAIRSDMIEKLADAIRPIALKSDQNPTGEFEITAQHMSFVGKSGDAFDAIMRSLGYEFRTETVTITSVSLTPQETSEEKTEIQTQQESTIDSIAVDETIESVSEDIPAETSDTVTINEKELEKKIWFWSPPVKSKPFAQKPKKFHHPKKSEPPHEKSQPESKKKPHKGTKKHKPKSFDKNKKHNEPQDDSSAPYVKMPQKHKISNENNPFAALMGLKKEGK